MKYSFLLQNFNTFDFPFKIQKNFIVLAHKKFLYKKTFP